MAIESGSRAWGFASPDSDYDVRFIYVRKETDYLKLEKFRDVIEWKLDDVLDINGWDSQKEKPVSLLAHSGQYISRPPHRRRSKGKEILLRTPSTPGSQVDSRQENSPTDAV